MLERESRVFLSQQIRAYFDFWGTCSPLYITHLTQKGQFFYPDVYFSVYIYVDSSQNINQD